MQAQDTGAFDCDAFNDSNLAPSYSTNPASICERMLLR
jgi:hypothetical protein